MSNPLYYPNRDMLASGFPTNWTLLKRLMWVRIMQGGSIAPTYETVTGNPVSFTTVRPAPLRQLSVAFSPVQAGSGDPSPDNVRPISGWSSLAVEQRGVNVWDEDVQHGYYTPEGNFVPNASYVASKLFSIKPSTDYRVIALHKNFGRICYYDTNKSFVSSSVGYGSYESFSITTPANAYYMGFDMAAAYGGTYNNDVSINYPSTDTAYHAYNPASQTISINIGQTVYSGTLDVLTGVVTVDRASFALDSNVQQWGKYTAWGSDHTWVRTLPAGADTSSATIYGVPDGFICSFLKGGSQTETMGGTGTAFWIRGDNSAVYISINDVTTSTALETAVAGQTLVYPLATPQTIQLTPQEVESLLGENNMWSDANGDLTVEYRSN